MKAISAQSLSHFFKVAISIAIFTLMVCLALLGAVSLAEKAGLAIFVSNLNGYGKFLISLLLPVGASIAMARGFTKLAVCIGLCGIIFLFCVASTMPL